MRNPPAYDPNRTIWFTADLHFLHANIIRFQDRPFNHIDEHDVQLIKNWNSVVKPQDRIYVIGDFALGPYEQVNNIAAQLNGEKFLILGNHDKNLPDKYFTILGHYHELKQKEFEPNSNIHGIILCHYPMVSWNRAFHGSWMLYGHVHGRNQKYDKNSLRLDVGVDCHHYFPVSYQEIKVIMKDKNWEKGRRDGDVEIT